MSLMKDLQLQSRHDRLGWLGDVSDTFSVSSPRDFIDRGMINVTSSETTWNNWVHIKVNILIWRIRLHSIPIRERFSHRGIEVESIMWLVCHNVVETVDHIFTKCTRFVGYLETGCYLVEFAFA